MSSTDFVCSNVDVVNNTTWKKDVECLVVIDSKMQKGIVKLKELYDQGYTTDQSKSLGATAVGKFAVEVSTTKNQIRNINTLWFIIYKKPTNVHFLVGNYSLQPVPNSAQDVGDRQQIVGNSQEIQFNAFTVQVGLPLQVRERIIFNRKKLQDLQSKCNKDETGYTKATKIKIDEYLKDMNDALISGSHDEAQMNVISSFFRLIEENVVTENRNNNQNDNQNNNQNNNQSEIANKDDSTDAKSGQNDDKNPDSEPCEPHKCPFCEVSMVNYSYLRKTHILIEHEDEIRDQWMKCDVANCNEYFENKKRLKQHKTRGPHKKSRVSIQQPCPKCNTGTLKKGVWKGNIATKVFCSKHPTCSFNKKYIGDDGIYAYAPRKQRG